MSGHGQSTVQVLIRATEFNFSLFWLHIINTSITVDHARRVESVLYSLNRVGVIMRNTFTSASASEVVSAHYLLELWHHFLSNNGGPTSAQRGAALPSFFPLFHLSDWLLTDWGLCLKKCFSSLFHSSLSFDIYHSYRSLLWRAGTAGNQPFFFFFLIERSVSYFNKCGDTLIWIRGPSCHPILKSSSSSHFLWLDCECIFNETWKSTAVCEAQKLTLEATESWLSQPC